jgi:arylsulfatase
MRRLIVLAVLCALGSGEAWAQSSARPNILLILADDSGFSDLGCQGGEIRTPNLDALARGGARLVNFYNSARCCPSRASLMTGLHPAQAGFPDMTGRIPERAVTIPEVLRSAGYSTFMVGKWHLSHDTKPTDRGFDEFYGMLGGFNSFWQEDPYYTRWPQDRPKRTYAPGQFYSTDAFGDYALDFLEQGRQAGKPWFMYLAFNAPHFPLHAPEADIARYEAVYAKGWDAMRADRLARMKRLGLVPADLELTPRLVVPKNWANEKKEWAVNQEIPAWDSLPEDRRKDLVRRMATFAAMVDRLDQNVGRVVDYLQKSNQLENTLIFYLSDNGACGEWDPFGFDIESGPKNVLHTGDDLKFIGTPPSYVSYGSGWANACVTPYRYYKQYTHEGGVRTPLIVHYPSGMKRPAPGSLIRSPGYITDIMATCVDLAGASYPAERNGQAILPMEGASLVPVLEGGTRPTRPIYIEHEGSKAAIEWPWKVVRERDASVWELYDLATDPTEIHNLAATDPVRTTAMADAWSAWSKRVGLESTGPRVLTSPLELKPGQVLDGDEAPAIAGRGLKVEATVADVPASGAGGVIVSQGAQLQGWSLFVRDDGRPAFAVRRGGKLTQVDGPEALSPSAPTALAGELTADGGLRLSVNGREAASAPAGGGLIPSQPKDPLIVGDDRAGAVGSYATPRPFAGAIRSARLTVGDASVRH